MRPVSVSYSEGNMETSSGKETKEYKCVLAHLREITEHLKLNSDAKMNLTQNYKQKGWIDVAENPNEESLIERALGRISINVADFYVFIDMLNSIVGMDNIVTKIQSTL